MDSMDNHCINAGYQELLLVRARIYELPTLQRVIPVSIDGKGNRVQLNPEMLEHLNEDNIGEPAKSIKLPDDFRDMTTMAHAAQTEIQIPPAPPMGPKLSVAETMTTQKIKVAKKQIEPSGENRDKAFLRELKERVGKIRVGLGHRGTGACPGEPLQF